MNDHPRVQSFSSAEEMFNDMAKRELAADLNTLPKQREITPGSYFAKPVITGNQAIWIYCYAMTLEETVAQEADAGADEDEVAYYRRMYEDLHQRGYRYGEHYSEVVPNGEWGSSHISTCWPITEAEYEEAKAHEWTSSEVTLDRISREVVEATKEAGDERVR